MGKKIADIKKKKKKNDSHTCVYTLTHFPCPFNESCIHKNQYSTVTYTDTYKVSS